MSELPHPMVSVVMGVYNGETHLQRSISSVLEQEFSNFEFIIVNDGSTDGTAKLLDAAAEKDKRIRIVHQENVGLTKSLILGCSLARAKYIARQDADDFSFPDRFREQVDYLEKNPEVVLVSCWSKITGPHGEYLFEDKRPIDPGEATKLLQEDLLGPPGHGSVMFRKDAYERSGGYRPAFYFAQDFDLWLRLASVGGFAYIPKHLYSYEIATASISGGLHGAKLAYFDLVKDCHAQRLKGESDSSTIAGFLEKRGRAPAEGELSSWQKRKSSFRTNYFIGRCLVAQADNRAAVYFAKSLRDYPFSVKAWINLILSSLKIMQFSNRA